MEDFSPAELAQLYFIREAVIDSQFQFWITITFAVIVASFVAGKRLSRRSRLVIAVLYSFAVMIPASRWWYVTADAAVFRDALSEIGVALDFPAFTAITRFIIFMLGTSATLIFLLTNWFHDNTGK